jgi:Protein of unknown function (DUF3306)
MEMTMRNHVLSMCVLAPMLAFFASDPGRACETAKGAGLCSQVAAVNQADVSSGRVTNLEVLPPIETLTAQSDYTMFLMPNVPVEIHRRALRKLWLSDPIFAYRDGLDNYDFDYKGYPPDEEHGLKSFARVLEQ